MTIYQQVEEFLRAVWTEGDLLQILGRYSDGRASVNAGLYTDLHQAAVAACNLSRDKGMNVGWGLNPIAPSSEHALTTSHNVMRRNAFPVARGCWIDTRTTIMIDIDPERVGMKGIDCASTAAELESARLVCEAVKAYLAGRGWSAPYIVCSGNGFHLYYRADRCGIEWPSIRGVLAHLSKMFSSDAVKIDTNCANGARHGRVPFLVNSKGVETADRPHRRASVYFRPETFVPVPTPLVLELEPLGGARQRIVSEFRTGPRLLIDESGVQDLLAEFPEHFPCSLDSEDKGDGVYFYLDSCPVKGEPHTPQGKRTAIILRENDMGWSCFSPGCEEMTFRQVLAFVEKKSGHKRVTEIWDNPTEAEQERRWGGVEHPFDGGNIIDTEEPQSRTSPSLLAEAIDLGGGWSIEPAHYYSRRFEEQTPDIDSLTYEDLLLPFMEIANAEYDRLHPELRPSFELVMKEIVAEGDIAAMARYIGADVIKELRYWLYPESNPSRARAEQAAAQWMQRAAPDTGSLTADDLRPAFQKRALEMDAQISDYFGRIAHQALIEQILLTNDIGSMARLLGHLVLKEIAFRLGKGPAPSARHSCAETTIRDFIIEPDSDSLMPDFVFPAAARGRGAAAEQG